MSIKAILRNAGELLLGEVVSETEDYIDFVDLFFVVLGKGQNEQIGIQFAPVELICIQPAIPLKALTDYDRDHKFVTRVFKNQILIDGVTLKPGIVENYENTRKPRNIITPSSNIIASENDKKIINLFD